MSKWSEDFQEVLQNKDCEYACSYMYVHTHSPKTYYQKKKQMLTFSFDAKNGFWKKRQALSTALPAVHSNWPLLAKLFFGLVNLTNEVDKAFTRLWHTLFRPICELELTNSARLAILQKKKKIALTLPQWHSLIGLFIALYFIFMLMLLQWHNLENVHLDLHLFFFYL